MERDIDYESLGREIQTLEGDRVYYYYYYYY